MRGDHNLSPQILYSKMFLLYATCPAMAKTKRMQATYIIVNIKATNTPVITVILNEIMAHCLW